MDRAHKLNFSSGRAGGSQSNHGVFVNTIASDIKHHDEAGRRWKRQLVNMMCCHLAVELISRVLLFSNARTDRHVSIRAGYIVCLERKAGIAFCHYDDHASTKHEAHHVYVTAHLWEI